MAKKPCALCKKIYDDVQPNFAPQRSKWAGSTLTEVCLTCIEGKLDPENFTEVDSLFRFLNVPFLLDDWLRLVEINGKKALHFYFKMFDDGGAYKDNLVDWAYYNEKWLKAVREGSLEEEVPALQAEWLKDMTQKWQGDYSPSEFKYLEYLYENLLRSQNVMPGISQSLALLLCKKIVSADRNIREGLPTKDDIAEIKNLMAAGGFETKGTKNTGDFDTVGELFVWLEKKGWEPSFYDGVSRDEVDVVIKDTQAFLRRLVLNEPGLVDQVQQKKDSYIASKELESEIFMDDKQFDDYESAIVSGDFDGEMDMEDDDTDEDNE